MLIFGETLRYWSAVLAGVFFFLNFLTCYAMPWSKLRLPWAGDRPGVDPHDMIGHFPLRRIHAPLAWLALFFLGLHGILGFACALFSRCL